MIRLAIAKGRILEKCNAILQKVGIECKYNPITSRKLIIPTNYKNLEVIVLKPLMYRYTLIQAKLTSVSLVLIHLWKMIKKIIIDCMI